RPWPDRAVRSYRDETFRRFVRHAARTVPFYPGRFDELGVAAEDIRTLEDLAQLPVLTKPEVQERYPQFLSTEVAASEHVVGHTSGTTGGGLRLATTLPAIQDQWATWWRY